MPMPVKCDSHEQPKNFDPELTGVMWSSSWYHLKDKKYPISGDWCQNTTYYTVLT